MIEKPMLIHFVSGHSIAIFCDNDDDPSLTLVPYEGDWGKEEEDGYEGIAELCLYRNDADRLFQILKYFSEWGHLP